MGVHRLPRTLGGRHRHGARHLHLSLATVKTHIGRSLAKLHARDRAQLVIVAYETGVVGDRGGAADPPMGGRSRTRDG